VLKAAEVNGVDFVSLLAYSMKSHPDYFGFVDKIIHAPVHTPQMDILMDVGVVLPMQPPGVHLEWFAEQLHFPCLVSICSQSVLHL